MIELASVRAYHDREQNRMRNTWRRKWDVFVRSTKSIDWQARHSIAGEGAGEADVAFTGAKTKIGFYFSEHKDH